MGEPSCTSLRKAEMLLQQTIEGSPAPVQFQWPAPAKLGLPGPGQNPLRFQAFVAL